MAEVPLCMTMFRSIKNGALCDLSLMMISKEFGENWDQSELIELGS